ncbi:hypothetical protein KW800_01770 [Candidatus Parcubacteria bacterium]|nr:hypothetical protein [Candidatus Parcubacteria bacterium]
MVSVGIMVTLSGLIAFNQSHYTSGAELRNLANDLSLSLRQAQVYGISVKEVSPGSNIFNVGYGVEFNITSNGSNSSYIFFADRGVKNRLYDDGWSCPIGSGLECLDKVSISGGNYIESLCAISAGGAKVCGSSRLDITFVRPATEAHIIFDGDAAGSAGLSGACIKLTSTEGKSHWVSVFVTGQISVDSPACI